MDRGRTSDDGRSSVRFSFMAKTFARFLKAREPVKQPCRPGEFYCLRCKAPKRPAGDMADYIPKSATRGLLRGICPICDRLIHRAVSLVTIEQKAGGLIVTFQRAEQRIDDTASPPLKC